MRVTEYRCDRCGGSGATSFVQDIDLCPDCKLAFDRFMQNRDQVGEYVFELVDGPCPHYVPCSYPCTSVWERRKRNENRS